MSIIVCIDGLRFKTCYGVKLLDGSSTQTSQCPKHCPLDFCNLSILDSIHQGVLRLGGMVLKLLCRVFFAKGCNLVEIHFQIMCHFLCELILGCSEAPCGCQ